MNWQYIANGVDAANPLWSTIPLAGTQWTGIPGSWAADVIKLKDGKYRFYYNFCGIPPGGQCTGPRSYLGVAVSDRIDGPFIDQGIFLRSGMTPAEIAAGYGPEGVTSYDARIQPNTIDPDVFYDANGKLWMVYGSYSGGIFILEMDESHRQADSRPGLWQASRRRRSRRHRGRLHAVQPRSRATTTCSCRSAASPRTTATTSASRARKIPTGPFLDAEGRDMVNARGGFDSIAPFGVKLMGGFNFASAVGDTETARGYLSPGHNSAYYDAATKKHLLITHTRFPNRGEGHAIRVHEMFVNKDGWLVASPHRYVPIQGDNVVDTGDVLGDYKLINLGKDINRTAKQSVYVSLNADGSITGELVGKFKRDVTDPDRITIYHRRHPEPFEGVLQWQWNEAAGALTPIFTAVSPKACRCGDRAWRTRSPQDVLADVAAALALPAAAKDNSLTLPTVGARGTSIVWTSSNENIIGADGTVTRPNVGAGDQVVMLTAKLKFNGQTTSRSFQVTVPQRLPFNRVAQFDFENSLVEIARPLRPGPAHGQPHVERGRGGLRRGASGPGAAAQRQQRRAPARGAHHQLRIHGVVLDQSDGHHALHPGLLRGGQ